MSSYIVVIEDEPAVQELLRDVLESEGHAVLTIAHGGTAQEILRNIAVDLVLVDLMLPDVPGVQVVAWLRQHGHAHTPMIAMSADHRNVLFARGSGLFQDAIRKPFDIDDLIDVVNTYAGVYISRSYA